MKITDSTKHRMKELGLTTLRQWVFHKFMFNNVSFTQEDVNSQSGEKVYAKFARAFTKFEEETNIWKDPKVELPTNFIKRIALYYQDPSDNDFHVDSGNISYEKDFEDYSFISRTGVDFYKYNNTSIIKWCYEEDLIKQAQGE